MKFCPNPIFTRCGFAMKMSDNFIYEKRSPMNEKLKKKWWIFTYKKFLEVVVLVEAVVVVVVLVVVWAPTP